MRDVGGNATAILFQGLLLLALTLRGDGAERQVLVAPIAVFVPPSGGRPGPDDSGEVSQCAKRLWVSEHPIRRHLVRRYAPPLFRVEGEGFAGRT